MKNRLGFLYKTFLIVFCLLFFNIFAQQGHCYQTALITYPEYNKNWKQIYYGKQDNEILSHWVPIYSYSNNWAESVVFHAYNYAKGNSCYKMMMNLLNNIKIKNNTMKYNILKDNYEDSIAIWCADKTPAMSAQCEILRVTSGHEGLISIHYINKNKDDFLYQHDTWLKIIKDIRIYYSYYRWDRVLQKQTSVPL